MKISYVDKSIQSSVQTGLDSICSVTIEFLPDKKVYRYSVTFFGDKNGIRKRVSKQAKKVVFENIVFRETIERYLRLYFKDEKGKYINYYPHGCKI